MNEAKEEMSENYPKFKSSPKLLIHITIAIVVVIITGFSIGIFINKNSGRSAEQFRTQSQLNRRPSPYPTAEPIKFDFKKHTYSNNEFLSNQGEAIDDRMDYPNVIKASKENELVAFGCELDFKFIYTGSLLKYEPENRREVKITEPYILNSFHKAEEAFSLSSNPKFYSLCRTEDGRTLVWIQEEWPQSAHLTKEQQKLWEEGKISNPPFIV